MSTPQAIRVRLLRAVRVAGGVRVAGACLDVSPAEARDLLRLGQAVLVHPSDLALLLDTPTPGPAR